MESLESRTARLTACEAIRACVYTYAMAGDRGNEPGLMRGLFTRDATYEAAGIARFQGRDAIVEGLAAVARELVVWSFHAPSGPLIRLADDLASAKLFWWVWVPANLRDEQGTLTPHWAAGHYNADIVVDEGAWRFRRVLFETRLRTPFVGPWTAVDGPFEWPA